MSGEEAVFYAIAAITVAGALGVVLARNIVHSALFLILSLLAVAGLFVLLAAEFLAIVQVLIYGGAVTILILFAMMLTRVRDAPSKINGPQAPYAAAGTAIFMIATILAIINTEKFDGVEEINVISFDAIGDSLFTTWALPFEIASLVLIVALVGAIILARGEEGE